MTELLYGCQSLQPGLSTLVAILRKALKSLRRKCTNNRLQASMTTALGLARRELLSNPRHELYVYHDST